MPFFSTHCHVARWTLWRVGLAIVAAQCAMSLSVSAVQTPAEGSAQSPQSTELIPFDPFQARFLSHMYDPKEHDYSKKAAEAFAAFVGENGGMEAALKRNIDARAAFLRAAFSAQTATAELNEAMLAADVRWSDLRVRKAKAFGLDLDVIWRDLTTRAGQPNSAVDPAKDPSALDAVDAELLRRINERQTILISITDTLSKAVAAKAKVIQDREKAAKNNNNLTAEEKAAATAAATFNQSILDAIKKLSELNAEFGKATNEQRKLTELLSHARRPTLSRALVPLVGAGLDTESMNRLMAFKNSLEKLQSESPSSVTGILQNDKTLSVGGSPLMQARKSQEPAPRTSGANAAPPDTSPIQKSLEGVAQTQALVKDVLDLLASASLGLDSADAEFTKKLIDELAKTLGDGKLTSTELMSVLQKDPAKARLDAIETKLLAELKGAVSEEDLNNLRAAIGDVSTLSVAAKARLVQYLAELKATRKAIDSEELRHDSALLEIMQAELCRWELLGKLFEEYQDAWGRNGVSVSDGRVNASLFQSTEALNEWREYYKGEAERRIKEVGKAAEQLNKSTAGSHTKVGSQSVDAIRPQTGEGARQAEISDTGFNLESFKLTSAFAEMPEGTKNLMGELNALSVRASTSKAGMTDIDVVKEMIDVANEAEKLISSKAIIPGQDVQVDAAVKKVRVAIASSKEFASKYEAYLNAENQAYIKNKVHVLFPAVSMDEFIWTSTRELAEAARWWHRPADAVLNGQAVRDPLGYHIIVANDRLHMAVRLVQGHLLITSINHERAAESYVRLVSEITLHETRLDGFGLAVTESSLRLAISDLEAYFGTGINDKDFETLMSVALGLISYKAVD